MIDVKVMYQAVAFMPSIEANQNNISQMMGLFTDIGLIPTTFQEITPISPAPQLRFSLQSANNEWFIFFGFEGIRITKNPIDPKGNNLGSIEQFSVDVSNFLVKILNKQPKKANRIALSSNVILEEMTEESLNNIYGKLFNPIQLYSNNKPIEWNSRTVFRLDKQVDSIKETLNFISEINRSSVLLNQGNMPINILNQGLVPTDRIFINLDINTIPNNTKYRFGEAEIATFYKNMSLWHKDLLKEILEKIK